MMASRVEEWRRHLKGCAGFLRAQKWNGSSEGIVKASFWAFARIGEFPNLRISVGLLSVGLLLIV